MSQTVSSNVQTIAAAATPSVIPAVINVAGIDVPVMAMIVSVASLMLARTIAPASRRKLTKFQERCLTGLLVIILFLLVTGQLGSARLGAGMGAVWGVGLGMSGLLVVEFFGQKIMGMLYVLFGQTPPVDGDPK